MSGKFREQFKEDAVRYYKEHKEMGLKACAAKLGVSKTALSNWIKISGDNGGRVQTRGSGNFESDEAKENARLRKELRDKLMNRILGIIFPDLTCAFS